MKLSIASLFLIISFASYSQSRFDVSSGEEFSSAQQQAIAGDSIVWLPGVYTNTRMELNKDGLIITAKPYGSALFSGSSRAIINASNVTFSGFQYVGGLIPSLNVIEINGSDVLVTQINIQNYTSRKYLIVDEESRRTTISYCNFENRLNLDDQNILSILVDNEPGYHKIQHCSFKNFDGIGNDQGIEPIRIGVSSQKLLESRTLVEYCYFTRCNGDGEIISHKARQNVYRYNTFEDNPVAELVLRHGDEGIVYGNFFLNNMGGIRIREGSNHYVFNNYFQGLNRRAIYLQNESSDPLSDIHIYHNTIIDSEELRLGGSGSNPPTNVFIANNIFVDPQGQLLDEETGAETWTSNFYFGTLGIEVPISGLSEIDPELTENEFGFFQPNEQSPVLGSSSTDYPAVPLFPGMEYDHEIVLDLMQSTRPLSAEERAIGASEFSSEIEVQPHATEMNTGPSYLFDNVIDYLAANASQLYVSEEGDMRRIYVSSNVDWTVISNVDWITTEFAAGSGDTLLEITIDPNEVTENRSGEVTFTSETQSVVITVFQDAAEISSVEESSTAGIVLLPNPAVNDIKLADLPLGYSSFLVEIIDMSGRIISTRSYQTYENSIEINVTTLDPGIYILNGRFLSESGTTQADFQRKFVKRN